METLYAQALWNESQKEGANAKTLLHNLQKNLKVQGREKLLPSILRELERLQARNAKRGPVVEVAHKKDEVHALRSAASQGIKAEHAVVNPELVLGWRASKNGKLIDHSGKRALVELYQKIIY